MSESHSTGNSIVVAIEQTLNISDPGGHITGITVNNKAWASPDRQDELLHQSTLSIQKAEEQARQPRKRLIIVSNGIYTWAATKWADKVPKLLAQSPNSIIEVSEDTGYSRVQGLHSCMPWITTDCCGSSYDNGDMLAYLLACFGPEWNAEDAFRAAGLSSRK